MAFNAMWTAPPPPSYTDTVGVDPTDYVVLSTSHGDEALVHKDCLTESPVLRFCFRKRVPLNTEEVVVDFIIPADAVDTVADAAASAVGEANLATSPLSPARSMAATAALGDAAGGEKDAVDGQAGSFAAESPTSAEDEETARRRVVLTDSLCTDNSIHIVFPRLNGAQLEVVVAYLYFKHHYNRNPSEVRPRFDIPPSAALEVMRVAKTLNC